MTRSLDIAPVSGVIGAEADRVKFGGGWHTDVRFLAEPDLVGIRSAGPQYGGAGYSTQSTAIATKGAPYAAASRVEHPVVTTHPETGRKGLYVNPAFTIGIKGMHVDARLRWQPGTVAMWDNRSMQHYALHVYRGRRRVMRRITIRGARPR